MEDDSVLQSLVDRPSEGLNVELKRWIDPDCDEMKAKIVKAALALRNHGGGYLVIGFDNKSLLPDVEHNPHDVRAAYNFDKIQGLISGFSSDLFDIKIVFKIRTDSSQEYPIIIIPSGILTPVGAKHELVVNGKTLVKAHQIYVRSLSANGTVSSSEAKNEDYKRLMETCFENREADIGRFLRRHLTGVDFVSLIKELQSSVDPILVKARSFREELELYIDESNSEAEGLYRAAKYVVNAGYWEIGLIIEGELKPVMVKERFHFEIDNVNPRHSGWPIWLNLGAMQGAVGGLKDESWDYFEDSNAWRKYDHTIVRLSPTGKFYHRRSYFEDAGEASYKKMIDYFVFIYRVAEAISVGLAFGKYLCVEEQKSTLHFLFRWNDLNGRYLDNLSDRQLDYHKSAESRVDSVDSYIAVPVDTAPSAIEQYVIQTVQRLYYVFGAYEMNTKRIIQITQEVISQRYH